MVNYRSFCSTSKSPAVLEYIVKKYKVPDSLYILAENENTPSLVLNTLAHEILTDGYGNDLVISRIGQNKNTLPGTLRFLIRNGHVQAAVANENITLNQLKLALTIAERRARGGESSWGIFIEIAKHKKATKEILAKIAGHDMSNLDDYYMHALKSAIISNEATPRNVIEQLSHDLHPKVREESINKLSMQQKDNYVLFKNRKLRVIKQDADCSKCEAMCCKIYNPETNKKEINKISKYFNFTEQKTKESVFFSDEQKCLLQGCKPSVCKNYPMNGESCRAAFVGKDNTVTQDFNGRER